MLPPKSHIVNNIIFLYDFTTSVNCVYRHQSLIPNYSTVRGGVVSSNVKSDFNTRLKRDGLQLLCNDYLTWSKTTHIFNENKNLPDPLSRDCTSYLSIVFFVVFFFFRFWAYSSDTSYSVNYFSGGSKIHPTIRFYRKWIIGRRHEPKTFKFQNLFTLNYPVRH